MKTLKVTKKFNQVLNILRACHMGEEGYKTLADIVAQIIMGNEDVIREAFKTSKTIKDNAEITVILISDDAYKTLKTIQSKYKVKHGKKVSLGEITETLCSASLRACCYRELM